MFQVQCNNRILVLDFCKGNSKERKVKKIQKENDDDDDNDDEITFLPHHQHTNIHTLVQERRKHNPSDTTQT